MKLLDDLRETRTRRDQERADRWRTLVEAVANGDAVDADAAHRTLAVTGHTDDDLRRAVELVHEARELQALVGGRADAVERRHEASRHVEELKTKRRRDHEKAVAAAEAADAEFRAAHRAVQRAEEAAGRLAEIRKELPDVL